MYVEGGLGQEEHQDDADHGQRHRKHDDEGVAERLVETGHDHVDQNQRQHKCESQLAEGLLLLLVVAAEANGESPGHGHGAETLANVRENGPHVPAMDIGAYGDDALLVLAFNADRTGTLLQGYDVPQHDRLPVGVGDSQIEDFAHAPLLGVLELHPDGELVATFAIVACAGARDHRLQHVGDLADGHLHGFGFGPVHGDEAFGRAGVPADEDIGDTFDLSHNLLYLFRQHIGGFQIKAADLHLHALGAAAHPTEQKQALPRPGSDGSAGDAGKLLPQDCGDLLAGTLPFGLGLEGNPHVATIRAAAPPVRAAEARHDALALGHLA